MATDKLVQKDSQLDELTQFLADTAAFEAKAHGWEIDADFELNDGQVFYSIDTDIFDMYLKPFAEGPDRLDPKTNRRSRQGYAQIFRDDPVEVSGVVAEALSEAIFFKNSEDYDQGQFARHLLVLPGVESEVMSALDSILRRAMQKGRKAQEEVTEADAAEKIRTLSTLASEARYDELQKSLPKTFDLLFDRDSPKFIADRMRRLTAHGSVTFSEKLGDGFADRFPPRFIEILQDARDDEELKNRRKSLESRLRELDYKVDTQTDAHERDLKLLSELLTLNELLIPEGYKICHVTGAWRIHEALRSIKIVSELENPFFEEGRVLDKDEEHLIQGSMTANTYCIRYPLAFWRSKSFKNNVRPEQYSPEEHAFIDDWTSWVDPIVSRKMARENQTITQLKGYARRAMQVGLSNGAVEGIKQRWTAFSALIVPSRASASKRFSKDFEGVFTDLNKAFSNAFEALFDSCAELGLAVSAGSSGATQSRLNPPIIFECNEQAQAAINQIEHALSGGNRSASSGSFTAAFEALRESNVEEDRYFFNVGIAVVFANERQFQSAKLYADRAVSCANNLSKEAIERSEVTGRESYFLNAILTRLTARSPSDYERAKVYLRLARNRLEQDRLRNPNLGISNFRFECEDIARELGLTLFRRFSPSKRPIERGFASSVMQRTKKLQGAEYETAELWLKEKMTVRLAINAITANIFCDDALKEMTTNDLHRFDFQKQIEIVRSSQGFSDTASRKGSYLHSITILAARCLTLTAKEDAVELTKIADKLLTDSMIRKHKVTAYDADRFNALKLICQQTLGIEIN